MRFQQRGFSSHLRPDTNTWHIMIKAHDSSSMMLTRYLLIATRTSQVAETAAVGDHSARCWSITADGWHCRHHHHQLPAPAARRSFMHLQSLCMLHQVPVVPQATAQTRRRR